MNNVRRGKHVLAADGAVAVDLLVRALVMTVGHRDRHAKIAVFAVEKVDPEALANAADATVVTVIDGPLGIVLPQMAHLAII